MRRIIYPDHVVNAGILNKIAKRGVNFEIARRDLTPVRKLDNFKGAVFGGGFLLSERATAERAAAERATAERATAERAMLSEREWRIIRALGEDRPDGEEPRQMTIFDIL